MAVTQKKSIYLTGALIPIYNSCKDGNCNRSFSGRVADITDRYTALIELTDIPEITDEEKMILGECVLGTFLDKLKIKHLPEYIIDTKLNGSVELAKKVKQMTHLQRVALIESLGI